MYIQILPTPFLPVHLLFINLITDSLPAIAIGMEKGSDEILKQKPRGSGDSLLNKETILQVSFEGIIICIFTMLAYFIGLRSDEFHSLFSISELSLKQLAIIFVSAAFPSIIIQIYKMVSSRYN